MPNVQIYQHIYYGGSSQSLGLGNYNVGSLSIGNDVLSSLRVPYGWKVTLYEHRDFQGRTKVFTTDSEGVGDFNDLTSSIKIELNLDSYNGDNSNNSFTGSLGKYWRLDGNGGNDTLNGADLNDTIYGNEGIDWLDGNGGNDYISGGANDDYLWGRSGDDYLDGGDGSNYGSGNEFISGGTGNDQIFGRDGNDYLFGSDVNPWDSVDNDTIRGGLGNDYIDGGSGDDVLYGGDLYLSGDGSDTIYGKSGNDILYGGSENDDLQGGDGNDTLIGVNLVAGSLGIGEIDVLTGGSGADKFVLGSADFTDPFYVGGNGDYAIIKDLNSGTGVFNSAEGDKLVLKTGFRGLYEVNPIGIGTNTYSLSIFGEQIAEIQNITGTVFQARIKIFGSFEYV